ncbi:MAG: hypothetical protein K6A35_01510 [bacterium]|nr:hypothetical protein [bacterium]
MSSIFKLKAKSFKIYIHSYNTHRKKPIYKILNFPGQSTTSRRNDY